MTVDPGMPKSVLRLAQLFGVHNDCLASQIPCDACRESVVAAFDKNYGHLDTVSAVLGAVWADFVRDEMTQDSWEITQ